MTDICSQSSLNVRQDCADDEQRFLHSPITRECGRGCPAARGDGFDTLAECLATCAGSQAAVAACDSAADCTWTVPGCCGGCEPVQRAEIVSHNRSRSDTVQNCRPDVTCGACEDVQEWERVGQYFIPTCENHTCKIADIRELPATECEVNTDCELRIGSNCCAGCSGQGLISVSSLDWLDEICPDDIGCPECAGQIPDGFVPTCRDSRCVVGAVLKASRQ